MTWISADVGNAGKPFIDGTAASAAPAVKSATKGMTGRDAGVGDAKRFGTKDMIGMDASATGAALFATRGINGKGVLVKSAVKPENIIGTAASATDVAPSNMSGMAAFAKSVLKRAMKGIHLWAVIAAVAEKPILTSRRTNGKKECVKHAELYRPKSFAIMSGKTISVQDVEFLKLERRRSFVSLPAF